MDLGFRPLLPDREIGGPPGLAVLVAAAAVAQRGSATARAQAILDVPPPASDRLTPSGGSFDAAVARALWRWRRE